jgi:hypothetical protein
MSSSDLSPYSQLIGDGRHSMESGGIQRCRTAGCSTQNEGTFEKTEKQHCKTPCLGSYYPAVLKHLGGLGDPALKDLGGGLSEGVIGAGHLQGDGGDGAGVGVVGLNEVSSGTTEEVVDGIDRPPSTCERRNDELAIEGTGPEDRFPAELLFSAGEEMVNGTQSRLGLGDDLGHARSRVALTGKQFGADFEDSLSGLDHRAPLVHRPN